MTATIFPEIRSSEPLEAELFHHVTEHKYYVNQYIPYEISMDEAFESWTKLVYGPLSAAIDEEGLDAEFRDISEDELFLRVCRHWHLMKQDGTISVSAREAVYDFGSQFSQSEASRVDFQLKKQFL